MCLLFIFLFFCFSRFQSVLLFSRFFSVWDVEKGALSRSFKVKSMDEAFNIIDGGEPGSTSNSESRVGEEVFQVGFQY